MTTPRRLSPLKVFFNSLFIASVLGLFASITLAWLHAVNPQSHNAYTQRLRLIQSLDASLNQHLLMARSGLTVHYDFLARLSSELRQTIHILQKTPPPFLDESSQKTLLSNLNTISLTLSEKLHLIERFKRENAVFRNSLAYFPTAASALSDRLSSDHTVFTQLRNLLIHILLFNQFSTRDLIPKVEADIAATAKISQTIPQPSPISDELNGLLRHARAIVSRKPTIDSLVAQILSSPISQHIEHTERAYASLHHTALDTALIYRSAVFVCALLILVLGSFFIISRMRASAIALSLTTDKLRAANASLRVEREREKELSDLKNRFVSMASHEFRTPLSVIMSSTELLENYRDRWPPDKVQHHFSRISASVHSMTRLLEGVLTIGRADANALSCSPSPTNLPELCALAVDAAHQSSPNDPRISFHFHLLSPTQNPQTVPLDPNLLERILSNLLSNALKYSPQSSPVAFDVSLDDTCVLFVIRDHGIGISPDDLPKLFQSFHRGENVGNIAGTGLGLAIVKRALDLHHGTIEVFSTLGSGTTMQIRIPTHGLPP